MMVRRSLLSAVQALSMALWLQTMDVVAFLPHHEYISTPRTVSRSIVSVIVPSTESPAAVVSHRSSSFAPFKSSPQQLRVIRSRISSRSFYKTILFSQPSSTPVTTNNDDEKEKELTPSAIAELIEVSFLQSCLQLSQGYIDVLKLFIVAVKAGYERSLSLEELHQLVQDCPVNSAGRDYVKEERDLRLEWMRVVYELLNALKIPDHEAGVDSSIVSGGDDELVNTRVSEVVQAMLAIQNELQNEEDTSGGKQDATVVLSNLTADQALERSPSLSKLNESMSSSPMEKAFLINDIRVALVTFRVLEEEKVCIQDRIGTSGGKGLDEQVPRPPIPGT
mmetsp:Transcript_31938/g.67152  ORF Transcript_31938/g.67152 Transcript_31938/m.67152 type:complete len:336 (+) Transcript_31938:69-1076(+)